MNPIYGLKLECQKYLPNGTFRVIVGFYVGAWTLVLVLARLVGRNMTFSSNGMHYNPTDGLFQYPQNWELLASLGSWMNLFLLGFLGVFMITLEFGNRTLRQSVIFGMSRLEVAASKLAWSAALALAATGFYLLLGMAWQILDGTGMGLPPADCVLRFFLQALGYLCLGTLLGFVVRQTALATVGYLAYVLVLENAGRWIFYFSVAKSRWLLFLPHQLLGALTPWPVPASVKNLIQPLSQPVTPTEATLAALVYIGLFALLFCRKITKSDL